DFVREQVCSHAPRVAVLLRSPKASWQRITPVGEERSAKYLSRWAVAGYKQELAKVEMNTRFTRAAPSLRRQEVREQEDATKEVELAEKDKKEEKDNKDEKNEKEEQEDKGQKEDKGKEEEEEEECRVQ
ncbi:unnamed protein product, partial [Polarella glacialis]